MTPEELERDWLKTSERFGDLAEPEHIKAIAEQGFKKDGRGVVFLAIRHGQPGSKYLPSYRLPLMLDDSDYKKKLLDNPEDLQPGKF